MSITKERPVDGFWPIVDLIVLINVLDRGMRLLMAVGKMTQPLP